jgi:hypothetical protein
MNLFACKLSIVNFCQYMVWTRRPPSPGSTRASRVVRCAPASNLLCRKHPITNVRGSVWNVRTSILLPLRLWGRGLGRGGISFILARELWFLQSMFIVRCFPYFPPIAGAEAICTTAPMSHSWCLVLGISLELECWTLGAFYHPHPLQNADYCGRMRIYADRPTPSGRARCPTAPPSEHKPGEPKSKAGEAKSKRVEPKYTAIFTMQLIAFLSVGIFNSSQTRLKCGFPSTES